MLSYVPSMIVDRFQSACGVLPVAWSVQWWVWSSGIAEPPMPEPASALMRLPPELWEHILLQLTPCEALRLRAVKSLNAIWHAERD